MKKYFSVSFFVIIYAVFFSIGAECLINVLSAFVSIFPIPTLEQSFWLFCLAVGFLVLVAFVIVLLLNIKSSINIGYTKRTWLIQMISAVIIAIPMIKIWEIVFRALFGLNLG